MHNSRNLAERTGRRNAMTVVLLLITLLLGGVSVARAQTAGTNAGGSATSSTPAITDEQRANALKDPEVAGYVFGKVLGLLLCPAAVIFVLYKAFGKKGGANGGPANTLNKS